jgi:alkylglycerol monooxygenase
MKVDLIVLAIPVFLLLIVLELVIARVQERQLYRLSDTINDLSCGMISQLFEALMKTVLFAGYLFLYERARLAEIPASAAWAWVVCFLGVDFLYYWFHRLSHEVNAFWAAHVVHHQSEDYNLAVALRQGTFQSAFSWVFYLPLAVIGFPPLMFLTVSSLDTLYQFWIHTRVIGRLGPLEWVLNTPSHHRVHHGRNPLYIDRNHAGTLIVWDRMFGTFQEEKEEAVFGITTPLRSWNPVWANLHYWVELFDKAKRTARWSDKVRMFLKPPGWNPEDLGGFQAAPPVDPATYRKWDSPRSTAAGLYAMAQFALVLAGTALLLNVEPRLPRPVSVAGALAVVASLVALGALLDGKAWGGRLEATRLVLLAAAVLGLASSGAVPWPVAGAALALVVVSLGGLALVLRSSPTPAPEASVAP